MVFKEGVASASKHLVLYARANKLNFSRLGLSVSKKLGKAVTRNRIKRLLREAMRKLSEEITKNHDFVIVARKSSREGNLDDFMNDIRKSLKKLLDKSTGNAG